MRRNEIGPNQSTTAWTLSDWPASRGVRAGERGDVAGRAGQRRQVAAGRVAPGGDAAGVELVLAGVGAQPADGGLDVVDGRREAGLLAQPVVDADHGVAALEGLQDRRDLAVGLVAADEPAAVDGDDDRVRRLALLGQVQVAASGPESPLP